MIRVLVDGTDIDISGYYLLVWPHPVTEMGREMAVVPRIAIELGYTRVQGDAMEVGTITPCATHEGASECLLYRNRYDARATRNPIARLIVYYS